MTKGHDYHGHDSPSVEEAYGKIQSKHQLPLLKDMYADFELHTIEDTGLLLAEIRKKALDKVDSMTMVLQPILQPDTNINDLHECRMIPDQDKHAVSDLYARLMVLVKRGIRATVLADEKEDAAYIRDVCHQYPDIKKSIAHILTVLEEGWKKAEEAEEGQWYVG